MISQGEWRRLVADYEAAGQASDAACDAADALGAHDPAYEAADASYEAARRVFEAAEDELLDAVAPDLEAVAYQLRVFAERFHSAVIDAPAMSGEDHPAGDFLRNILTGMLAHRGRPDAAAPA